MKNIIDFIKNNRWARYVLVALGFLVLGILLAYFTMQTKIIKKDQEIQALTTTNSTLTGRVDTLITQNTKLQQQINQQQHQVTITHPDGTVVHTVDTNTQTNTNIATNIETSIKAQYELKFEEWKKEYIKTHTEELTNPKSMLGMLFADVGPKNIGVNFAVQGEIFGNLGIMGGGGIDWYKASGITDMTTNWDKPALKGLGGLTYKFK